MNSGDILLFQSNYTGAFGWWAYIVSLVTRSKWTHVAMVLKDPTFIDESFKGLYVIESGTESWVREWGVIASPLDKILSDRSHLCISYRKLNTTHAIKTDALEAIYVSIKNKPYDTNPSELLGNALKSTWLSKPRELDRFVCSSLVAYIYTALGLLPEDTSWFFYQPWHFSSENPNLRLKNCSLDKESVVPH